MKSAYDTANEELSKIGEFIAGSDNGNDASNAIDRDNNTIALSIYNPTPSVMSAKLFNFDASYFQQQPAPDVVAPATALSFIINPRFVEYCPANNFMYIGSSTTGDIEVVDCATNTSITSINCGVGGLRGMAYNSQSNTMYVTAPVLGGVHVIDCATNTLITTIPVGNTRDIAYSPVNNRMYAVTGGTNTIIPIDCATNTALPAIVGVIQPQAITYNPVNNSVYCVANSAVLTVVDCNTNTISSTTPISAGFHTAIEYCPPNNTMYVTNITSNDVEVINCVTNLPIGLPINVGATPVWISYNMFDNLMYVTNNASLDISVIDCSTNLVINTIPTASNPYGIAYNFNTNTFYAVEELTSSFFTVSPSVPFVASAIITPSGGVSPAEIYNDLQTKPIIIRGMKMITDNFQQLSQNFTLTLTSYTGSADNNQYQPLNYVSPSNPTPKILDMPDFNFKAGLGSETSSIDFNVEPFTKVALIFTVGRSLDSAALFSENKEKVQHSEVIRNTGNPIVDMILKEDFKGEKADEGEYFTTTEESIYPRLTGNVIADIALLRSRGVQGIG